MAAFETGATVGPYQIVALLGAGGMGEVYRAHDSTLGRDVALKLLPQRVADDPQQRARLLTEARAAASLNHPNICTIHEVGHAGGQHYIAMELVEGQPLSARLAEGPLPIDEILASGLQLADALAHAHEHGVVHGDLKSANVMVTPEGRIKVLDFGLARRLSGEELADVTTRATSLDEPGAVLGTLPYMAPEQLRAQPVNPCTDVWALGVVLYEMAAGRRPFAGRTGFELSSAIFHEPPPPLPARVPPQLSAVTNRCLEKQPRRRYQRAGDVRVALEVISSGARPATSPLQAVDASRRRLVAAAVLLLALGLGGAALWLNVAGLRERLFGEAGHTIRSIAVLPLENRSGDPEQEYFVAGMQEALITDLARIGVGKVIARTSTEAFRGTTKPLRDIGRELGVEGVVTGSVLRSGDRLQLTAQLVHTESGEVVWANRYERYVRDLLSLQNELLGAVARELQAQLTPEQTARLATARPIHPAAHDAYLKGRFLYSRFTAVVDSKLLDAAIAQFEQAIQIDPAYAPPYGALSIAHQVFSQTSVRPPKDTFPKAKLAALKAIELDDTLAEAHAALAQVLLWYDWNWAEAESEIDRALQLNPNSVDSLTAHEVYSLLVRARFDEAAATSERILNLDPLNPFARVQTMWMSFFSRRYDDSIRQAKTLLELAPDSWFFRFFLAMNYAAKQMPQEVQAECGKMLQLLSGTYNMQALATCTWALGVVGATDEARRLLARLEQPPSGTWLDPAVMGHAYAALGDFDRAFFWYEKGIEERAPNMVYMKVSVLSDAARADRRYQPLLRRMNFPGDP